MSISKLKRIVASGLMLSLPLNTTALFANELLLERNKPLLISEKKDYRKHDDKNKDNNINDPHSIDHDWKNHYHVIRSIKLKKNGNLKIRFCEKVELLEGYVYAGDVKYEVKDAYKIKKRSIIWRLNKKGTFKNGDVIFVNTKNLLGRPTEKDPNFNEIRSLDRGCGLPFLYLPPGVEVSGDTIPIALLGLVIAIGAAAGGGGSGSSSSN